MLKLCKDCLCEFHQPIYQTTDDVISKKPRLMLFEKEKHSNKFFVQVLLHTKGNTLSAI